jgi:hypothetical protein
MQKKAAAAPEDIDWLFECEGLIPEVVVIHDEELAAFHDWLQQKEDHPAVALVSRWIGEFDWYVEDDQEALLELKDLLKSRQDPESATALQVIVLAEEEYEPDPMLQRFRKWLAGKGLDSTVALARWWLEEFEETTLDLHGDGVKPTLH